MNCTRTEKLLPLYAGGDIENADERAAISAHLEDCRGCSALARELASSREMLRMHEPPEFDAAFFNDVRQAVLLRIAETNAPSSNVFNAPAPFFARLFDRRSLAFAASVALLVVVAAALFVSRRPAVHKDAPRIAQLPVVESKSQQKTSPPVAENREKRRAPAEFKREAGRHGIQQAQASLHQEQGQASLQTRSNAGRSRAGSLATAGASKGIDAAHTVPELARSTSATTAVETLTSEAASATSTGEVAERKFTRIELQTADPNVRIIWLSPPASGPRTLDKTIDK